MRGGDLNSTQLAKLRDCLRAKVDYIACVRARMEQRNLQNSDRLYRAVQMSHEHLREVMHEIETLLSYRGYSSASVRGWRAGGWKRRRRHRI